MEELNSGPPKTNPSSGREEDLNPGPPDYKSSALLLDHARLPRRIEFKFFHDNNIWNGKKAEKCKARAIIN